MTAFAMKPTFVDRPGYDLWMEMWRQTYNRLGRDIRFRKDTIKRYQKHPDLEVLEIEKMKSMQREVIFSRAVARKMMMLRGEALNRWARIKTMRAEIAAQPFPLDLGECKNVDFHYNKGHGEFPFLPMWTVRAKGRSYYVNAVEADVPWTTRERATGSTKGVLRFPKCVVAIDQEGVAKIQASN